MSRAFLNEDKFEQAGDELVERPISPLPNYVTPLGFEQLRAKTVQLEILRGELKLRKDDSFAKQQLAEAERDLRYYAARLESAILIEAASDLGENRARFGATVTVEDEDGRTMVFSIVGEDEANVAQGKISWASPLAKALIGAGIGDSVVWQRPAGNVAIAITDIK